MIKKKKCSKCGKLKNISKFYKDKYTKDGYRSLCKICKIKATREWYEDNKERVRENSRKYRKNNPGQMKKYRKENIKKCRKQKLLWAKNNPEKIKESAKKHRKKRMSIPKNRLNSSISRAISCSLKGKKNRRHWEDLVGYSLQELIKHLENQFKENMTWQNMGKWHIDHIIPISFFEFNSFKDWEFKYCWGLNNLQPLWALENIRKGNKILQGEVNI